MKRTLVLIMTSVAVAACFSQAALSATTSIGARASFVRSAGVDLGSTMTLPAVSVGAVASSASSAAAASVSGGTFGNGAAISAASGPAVGNTQLTIRGQPGDVVSTTVPESFTVVRSGGQETLIVKTNTNAEYQIGRGDVVLGGAVLNGDTMSVDVGGRLSLASAQNLVPGPYEGTLVVVVQYN